MFENDFNHYVISVKIPCEMFHRKLPRKDSESSPKPSVLIVGSLHKFCILRLIVIGFFS